MSTGFDFNLFRAIEVFVAIVETRHVTQAAVQADAGRLGAVAAGASWALGLLELGLGRPDEAVTRLTPVAGGRCGGERLPVGRGPRGTTAVGVRAQRGRSLKLP